jgi:2Fe-2S ferredoxin
MSFGYDINVDVLYGEEEHHFQTYEGEYRSLMALIFDKIYTDEFGECKGIGRCGTCLVEILASTDDISTYERNEATTISRTSMEGKNLRLSCQIIITNHLKVKVKT